MTIFDNSQITTLLTDLFQMKDYNRFEFVWYENPQPTFPTVHHVQVFMRVRPKIKVDKDMEKSKVGEDTVVTGEDPGNSGKNSGRGKGQMFSVPVSVEVYLNKMNGESGVVNVNVNE